MKKGLSIPISVVEWPLNKSSTEATASIAQTDSLQKVDAMIREKDAKILRLSDRIKALELREFYFPFNHLAKNIIVCIFFIRTARPLTGGYCRRV